jgi:BlaI family penicillinase repressor
MSDISKTEFEVLNALWEGHPAPASEIIFRLNLHKKWHEKTVKTLLSRLVKKQAIDFEKRDRRYFYFPLLERSLYIAKESNSLVSRLFAGKVAPLVAGFANAESLTKDDVDELKSLIEQWEKDNV